MRQLLFYSVSVSLLRIPAVKPVCADYMMERSGKRSAERLAGIECVIIGLIVGRDAVHGEIRAGVPAVIFPIAHPFSVAPAVRAEQGDLFAGELSLYIVEHRLEFTLFHINYL